MDVKRYSPYITEPDLVTLTVEAKLGLHPQGKYVLATDYDALAAELAHGDECWKAQCDAEVALQARVAALEAALRGLYDDNIDYLRINNLGGYDNHWLVATRKALGITAEST